MMLTTRRGLVCLAFLVPAGSLFGFTVIMARKIVRRGPKDYRRAELTDDGRTVRIDLDGYTKAHGDFAVFDPAAERYIRVGEVTLIDEDQKFVERRIHPTGSGPVTLACLMKRGDLAKITAKIADEGELYQGNILVLLSLEQIAARPNALERATLGPRITTLQPVMLRVVDDLRPDVVRVADDDRVCFRLGFVGKQRDVIPA